VLQVIPAGDHDHHSYVLARDSILAEFGTVGWLGTVHPVSCAETTACVLYAAFVPQHDAQVCDGPPDHRVV
jgi:hypothetical protein